MKRVLFSVACLLFLLTGSLKAQSFLFTVEADQIVIGSNLAVDIYITKYAGNADWPLAASNFSFFVNGANLDIANATIGSTGPWNFSADPGHYWGMAIGKNTTMNWVNLVVFHRTDATPDPHVLVTSTRTRVGRVLIPILNPCGTNTLTWNNGPSAVTTWTIPDNLISKGNYIVPAANFPLCAKPAAPTIGGPAVVTLNQGQSTTLTASGTGTFVWYYNGAVVPGATGASLSVSQAGVYKAALSNCACVSDSSNGIQVNVLSNPLPVELLEFTGRWLNDKDALLQWTTVSEQNSARFDLERSIDQTTFTKIGMLPAAGISNVPKGYNLTDKNLAAGTYYYRLRIVDLDGVSHYSNVVSLSKGVAGSEPQAWVYPNPSLGQDLNLKLELPTTTEVSAVLYNSVGQQVFKLDMGTVNAGHPERTIPVKGMADGVYTLQVKAGAKEFNIKVILRHG